MSVARSSPNDSGAAERTWTEPDAPDVAYAAPSGAIAAVHATSSRTPVLACAASTVPEEGSSRVTRPSSAHASARVPSADAEMAVRPAVCACVA
jgi:hypothetical protein